jgi:hypothetical protein
MRTYVLRNFLATKVTRSTGCACEVCSRLIDEANNRKALHANVKWTISPITCARRSLWIADRARELGRPVPKWREFLANYPRHKEAYLAWRKQGL